MKEKINVGFNVFLSFVLKLRLLIILLISCLFILLCYPYFISQFTQLKVDHILFKLRKDNAIINSFFEKIVLLLDGKLGFLSTPFVYACTFIAVLSLIHITVCLLSRRYYRYPFYYMNSFFIAAAVYIYSYKILKLPHVDCLSLAGIVLFLYFCDFTLIHFEMLFKINFLKIILATLLVISIGISEVLFLPLYFKFIHFLNNRIPRKKHMFIIQNIHFYLLTFLLIAIMSPLNKKFYNISINLKSADIYSLVFSSRNSILFFPNLSNQKIESLRTDSREINFRDVYPPVSHVYPIKKEYNNGWPILLSRFLNDTDKDIDEIGDQLSVNEDRQELYIQDRKNRQLVIIDINDFSMKGSIEFDEFVRGFPGGDCKMVSANGDFLFLGSEDASYIAKIDVNKLKILVKKNLDICVSSLTFNKTKNLLYIGNFESQSRNIPYPSDLLSCYIYELNPENLEILRKIRVPSAVTKIIVSEKGDKIFCAMPFEPFFHSNIYVFDTSSFKLIDKIKSPLGTRSFVLDEKREIILAGSMVSNLIEVIDLKANSTLEIFKVGDFSFRDIVIDTKRRKFYASTRYFGLYEGYYLQ